jgi:hypothetical protein
VGKAEAFWQRRSTVNKISFRALIAITMAGPLVGPLVGFFAGVLPVSAYAAELSASANFEPSSANTQSNDDAALAGQCALLFSRWAGSAENARALLDGLHKGEPMTLTQPAATGMSGQNSTTVSRMTVCIGHPTGSTTAMTTTSTTFAPPTEPMSVRDTCIALAIAEKKLAIHRIARPAPAQIHAVLDGGTIIVSKGASSRTTQLPGILNQRANGMAWEKVAQLSGVRFAPIMAALRRSSASIHTASARNRQDRPTGTTTSALSIDPEDEERGKIMALDLQSCHSPGHGMVTALGYNASPALVGSNVSSARNFIRPSSL